MEVVFVALFVLLLAIPWLTGKVFSSANRGLVSRANNERAAEALARGLRFEIPAVPPAEVIETLLAELDLSRSAPVATARTYLESNEDDVIVFSHGKAMGTYFRACLAVERLGSDGTQGDFGIMETFEYDGRVEGVKAMQSLEASVRSVLSTSFPAATFSET